MDFIRGILGIVTILAIAYIFSTNRKAVKPKLIINGLLIQLFLAVFILKGEYLASLWSPLGWPKQVFKYLSGFFVWVVKFTNEGANFIFGPLAIGPGQENSLGMIFAFQVLPIIIFFAALTSILYYYGILQKIVSIMAKGMQKLLGISGAESLSVVSNIFIGQTEAPLVVKPYIAGMTKSELLAVMTGGMATIAGSVMAAYVQLLGSSYAEAQQITLEAAQLLFAEQLLGASVMAAPAALVIAKILVPETGTPETAGEAQIEHTNTDANVIDAAASGAGLGLKLAANVGGMLLAFVALLAMVNSVFGWFGELTTINNLIGQPLSFQLIMGWLFAPIAFLVGVPWVDAVSFGTLIGSKISINEFIAYLELSNLISDGALHPKTVIMATFALCGFANFSSIAIQIGGIGPMAPNKKSQIAALGLFAVLGGSLANLMTATIAGMMF